MIDNEGKSNIITSERQESLPIGGWLTLFAFGLPMSILGMGYYTYDAIYTYLTTDYIAIQSEIDNFTRNVTEQIDFYVVVVNSISFIMILVLTFLFFKQRKGFVNGYILFSILTIFFMFVTELLVNMVEHRFYSSTLASIIHALIWVTYLLKSKRVKNTFASVKRKYIKISKDEYDQLTNSTNNSI